MASKLPKSVARIPVPLYGGTLWLTQSIEDTQICAALLGREDSLEGCSGMTFPWLQYKGKRILLVMTLAACVPTLTHELAHATFNILDYAGVAVSAADDEAFCYLLGHLMQEALTHLKA